MGYVWTTIASMGIMLIGVVMIAFHLFTLGVYCAIIGFLIMCFTNFIHHIKEG